MIVQCFANKLINSTSLSAVEVKDNIQITLIIIKWDQKEKFSVGKLKMKYIREKQSIEGKR